MKSYILKSIATMALAISAQSSYAQCDTCLTPPPPSTVAEVPEVNINIYPNPVGDVLNIEAPPGLHTIAIRDLVGKTIFTLTSDNPVNSINMSAVRQGLYFIAISGEGYNRTLRVTKD